MYACEQECELALVSRSRYGLCFEVALDVAVDTSHGVCVQHAQGLVVADVGISIGSVRILPLTCNLGVFEQMDVPLIGHLASGLQCSAIETSLRSLIQ